MVLLRIRVGGLTLLAAEVAAGRRPRFWDVVGGNIHRLPAFLLLSLLQTAAVLATVAIFVGLLAGIYGALLGGHDINYYLKEQPCEWWIAVFLAGALGALFALGLLWLIARWLFAVPLLILGDLRPLEALRMTWRATQGDSIGLIRVFGLWWAGLAILSAALSALGWSLAKLLFDWAGYSPGWVAGCGGRGPGDSIYDRHSDGSAGVGRSPMHGDAHESAPPARNTRTDRSDHPAGSQTARGSPGGGRVAGDPRHLSGSELPRVSA